MAAVLTDVINRLQMGMPTTLQPCIGKHQVMAKSTLSMHYLSLYKVF